MLLNIRPVQLAVPGFFMDQSEGDLGASQPVG